MTSYNSYEREFYKNIVSSIKPIVETFSEYKEDIRGFLFLSTWVDAMVVSINIAEFIDIFQTLDEVTLAMINHR